MKADKANKAQYHDDLHLQILLILRSNVQINYLKKIILDLGANNE